MKRINPRLLPLVAAAVYWLWKLAQLPVYPDEEQWLYINSRQYLDNTMQYLFPVCTQGFQLNQPFTWLPIRGVLWLLYSNFGLINHIRLVGLIQGILTIFAVLKFLKHYSRNYKSARKILVIVLPLGTLPFLLTLNRPEQLMLLLLLVSANLSKTFAQSSRASIRTLIGLIQGLLVISIPAIHPKGLLFSLIALAIFLVQNWKSSKIFSSLLVLTSLISAKVSTQIWTLRTECPESEFISRTFRNITVNPVEMDASTPSMIFGNVLRAPKYLFHILYQQNYQSNWLSMKSETPIVLLGLANIGIILVVFALLQSLYKDLTPLRKKLPSLDLSRMLSCTFICSIILLTVVQRTKNFYDSYIPAMFIMLAVAVTIEKDISFSFKEYKLHRIILLLTLTVSEHT